MLSDLWPEFFVHETNQGQYIPTDNSGDKQKKIWAPRWSNSSLVRP